LALVEEDAKPQAAGASAAAPAVAARDLMKVRRVVVIMLRWVLGVGGELGFLFGGF
jgi:hypothetical protein